MSSNIKSLLIVPPSCQNLFHSWFESGADYRAYIALGKQCVLNLLLLKSPPLFRHSLLSSSYVVGECGVGQASGSPTIDFNVFLIILVCCC